MTVLTVPEALLGLSLPRFCLLDPSSTPAVDGMMSPCSCTQWPIYTLPTSLALPALYQLISTPWRDCVPSSPNLVTFKAFTLLPLLSSQAPSWERLPISFWQNSDYLYFSIFAFSLSLEWRPLLHCNMLHCFSDHSCWTLVHKIKWLCFQSAMSEMPWNTKRIPYLAR